METVEIMMTASADVTEWTSTGTHRGDADDEYACSQDAAAAAAAAAAVAHAAAATCAAQSKTSLRRTLEGKQSH